MPQGSLCECARARVRVLVRVCVCVCLQACIPIFWLGEVLP